MHVAWLLGESRGRDVEAGLTTLWVGLLDEPVRLTRVVPEGVEAPGGELGGAVEMYRPSWWGPLHRRRLERLAEALDARGVHLLHALDTAAWDDALEVGRLLNVPAILTAHAADDAPLAARLLRGQNPTRVLLTADTEPLARQLREATGNLVVVENVPTGVHTAQPLAARRGPEDPLCLVLSTDGPLDAAYVDALAGLKDFTERYPGTQVFIEGRSPDQHSVWKQARRLELLPHLSMVPTRLAVPDLLLSAHALLHPQATGRARPITLTAMAHGVPVLSVADPALDYLVPDHTCWPIDPPSPQRWAEALQHLADEPEAAEELGHRARAWVQEERLAAEHVARTLTLYRQLTGQPVGFVGPMG